MATFINIDAVDDRQFPTGIFSISPKILSAIFEYGKNIVDNAPLQGERGRYQEMAFEWAVSQTCQLFRSVAIGSPNLWTFIQLGEGTSFRRTLEYMARSGSCLLDVSIDERIGYSISEAEINIATRHSLRWRSLSLSCAYEDVRTPITARICSSPAPSLQYLSLQISDVERIEGRSIDDATAPIIFRDGTPHLKFLRLGGWAMSLFRPALNTLVTLHIEKGLNQGNIPYSTYRSMITQSPFLEHLSISGDVVRGGLWPETLDIITLPKLRSLRIWGVGGGTFPGILLGIHAPLLESLTLRRLMDEDLDKLWDLNDKIRYTNLRHLAFDDVDLPASKYNRLFETFHDITSFYILDSRIDSTPITSLLSNGIVAGQVGTLIPWPRLREIGFHFADTIEEERMLEVLAESRREQGYPFSRILLRISEDLREKIDEVETDGSTVCEFQIGERRWPPNSPFVDDGETQYV